MPIRASVASTRTATVTTFEHESQEFPLTQKATGDLEALKQHGLRLGQASTQGQALEASLKKAAELLKQVVGDINDRAAEERTRRQNRLQKRANDGEEAETEEEKATYDEFQQKVEELNQKLDESVRRVVDDQAWHERIPESLQHVIAKSKDAHTRREAAEAEGQSENEEAEEEPRPRPSAFHESERATALLHAAESTADTVWASQTLTERYSENPVYADFYKIRFDAQHLGENAPPIPPANTWFASQEGRGTQRRANVSQRDIQDAMPGGFVPEDDREDAHLDDEDTELQISSENRSCKCPLTLQYFKQPVTSRKCPHSFEKSAILGLIRTSTDRAPLTAEQLAVLNQQHPPRSRSRPEAEHYMRQTNKIAAQCPETGCREMLTADDLYDDQLLKRRTLRAIAAEERVRQADAEEGDGDDSDSDVLPGTQIRKRKRVVPIGSSPATVRRRTLIKDELRRDASVIPNSQPNGHSTEGAVMDVEDEEDEEEEDE